MELHGARIRTLENHKGNAIRDAEESQYWTVKQGFRETEIDATDTGETTASITIETTQTTVNEGQAVSYTITRAAGAIGKELTVVVQDPGSRQSERHCRRSQCDVPALGRHSRTNSSRTGGRPGRDRRQYIQDKRQVQQPALQLRDSIQRRR